MGFREVEMADACTLRSGSITPSRRAPARVSFDTVHAWSTSIEVRFAKSDPETPPTTEEQIALARQAARNLGGPQRRERAALSDRQELTYRRGVGLRGVDLGGASVGGPIKGSSRAAQ